MRLISQFEILSNKNLIVKSFLEKKDRNLRDLNQIINRLKDFFQLKNETEVAKLLNVEQNTLSSWKKRDKIPYERLDEIALQNKISIEWILSGDSTDMQKNEELLRYFNSLSQEKQEIYFLRIKADVLEKNIGLSQKIG